MKILSPATQFAGALFIFQFNFWQHDMKRAALINTRTFDPNAPVVVGDHFSRYRQA